MHYTYDTILNEHLYGTGGNQGGGTERAREMHCILCEVSNNGQTHKSKKKVVNSRS